MAAPLSSSIVRRETEEFGDGFLDGLRRMITVEKGLIRLILNRQVSILKRFIFYIGGLF